MGEDLSKRAADFALYLPAVQTHSAVQLVETSSSLRQPMPHGLTNSDLDWFNPTNKYWTYNRCLASAGHFVEEQRDNTVTHRHKGTFVLGDSGGYQIATGALKAAKGWAQFRQQPEKIVGLWDASPVRHDIMQWLEANCDYAMTIDMPLWVQGSEHEATPFHYLSEKDLTDITVSNLELIDGFRNKDGCKYLNVLQAWAKRGDEAASMASEDRWFDAVKEFKFEGWSLGGDVGARAGIYRVLRRLLLLRDYQLLAAPNNWCHLLGVSTTLWSVYASAIQRAIRAHTDPSFTVSYDSATPYLIGGRNQQLAVPPRFGAKMNDWIIGFEQLPTGYVFANDPSAGMFPGTSPIAAMFHLNELNPRGDAFAFKTTDNLSDAVLVNHNVYVYVTSAIEANEAVFQRKQAPDEVLKAVAIINQLFGMKDWQDALDTHRAFLEQVLAGQAD